MLHRKDLSLALLTADFEWKQGMLLRVSKALIKAIWILIFNDILRLHYWKISLSDTAGNIWEYCCRIWKEILCLHF